MAQIFKAQVQSETAEVPSIFDMNSKGGLQKILPLIKNLCTIHGLTINIKYHIIGKASKYK